MSTNQPESFYRRWRQTALALQMYDDDDRKRRPKHSRNGELGQKMGSKKLDTNAVYVCKSRDNLEKFWAEQFGTHHAIMVVDSFFENVSLHTMQHRALTAGEQEQNVVLQFTPKPAQSMLIACLYSHWKAPGESDVQGFAAITDEPPPDVSEAGHDRCIINLLPNHVDAWLTPEGRSAAELQSILSDRAVSVYQHEALQAA